MKMMTKFGYFTAITGFMIAPAHAQDKEQTDSDTDQSESKELSIDDEIDAELAAELERVEQLDALNDPNEFLKTFSLKKPLIILPTPEPARLAIAEKIVARLYPVGTNERVVRTMMDDMVKPIVNRTLDLSLNETIALFGISDDLIPLDEEDSEENRNKKFGDLVAEMDPKFREKMDVVFEAYSELTGLTSSPIEPALSQAMARDYARTYSLEQLNDLNVFFATATGQAFAKNFMLSTASIDMVQTALQEFPAIAENSEKIQEINKRIEAVFKTEEEGDEICDDENCESDEATEDVTAFDQGDEPWFDQDNWDDNRRSTVDQLADTYNELAELSEQAYNQYDEAFDAAVAESREQYIANGWTREEISEDDISDEETE